MRTASTATVALLAASALWAVACRPLSKGDVEAALKDFDTAVDRRDWDAAKRFFAPDADVVVFYFQSETPDAERIRSDELIDRQAKALELVAAYERHQANHDVVVEDGGNRAIAVREVEESFVLPDGRAGKVVSEETILLGRGTQGIRIVSFYLRIKSGPELQ